MKGFKFPRYKRKGKCNRCGWCCEYHGCELVKYKRVGLFRKREIAVCTIHKDRPQRCVVFPEAPPILHEGCGFSFVDTWENNRPVKYGKDL